MSRTRIVLAAAATVLLTLALASSAGAFAFLNHYGTGTAGAGAGQLDEPEGLAVDPAGNVYIADLNNNRIDVYSAAGGFQRAFGWGVQNGATALQVCTTTCQAGIPGAGGGQFNLPSSVALDAAGNLFVTELGNARVQVVTPDGGFVRQFGSPGSGAGNLSVPRFVALDAAGNAYVTDSGNQRVSVFTHDGAFVRVFGWGVQNGAAALQVCASSCQAGLAGGGAGELNEPRGIYPDSAGNLYVAEAMNNRVSVFTTQGAFQRAFGWGVQNGAPALQTCTSACLTGIAGGGAGQLRGPRGLVVDAAGNLQIADDENHRIAAFTAQGAFIRAFGKAVVAGDPATAGFDICSTACQTAQTGTGPGEFADPVGIAVDCRGAVYVGDFGNNRGDRLGDDARTPPCPSNVFSFGKVKRNKKKGTAGLPANLPGAGSLTMSGKGVKPVTRVRLDRGGPVLSRAVSGPGTVKLTIKAKGKTKRTLKKKHKVKVKVSVTFTPVNGDPNTQPKTVKLVLRHKRKR